MGRARRRRGLTARRRGRPVAYLGSTATAQRGCHERHSAGDHGDRHATAAQGGSRAAVGGGSVHRRHGRPRCSLDGGGSQPARPCPDQQRRPGSGSGVSGSGGRLQRRGLRRPRGGPAALCLAGDSRHEEPAAPVGRHRRGVPRRADRGGRAGGEPVRRGRCGRGSGGRVRATRCGRRPRGRCRRQHRHPPRHRHQRQLRVGTDARRGGRRCSLRRGDPHRQRALRAAASHPRCHGAARRGRGTCPARRRRDRVLLDADPPRAEGHAGADGGSARAQDPRRGTCRGRGIRLEAERLRRRGDLPRPGVGAGRTRPLDRGTQRGGGRHDPGEGTDPGHLPRRRCRRQGDGGARVAHRRHGRLPATGDARRPAARRLPLPRLLRHRCLLLPLHQRVHQQDPHRRLSRRGTA